MEGGNNVASVHLHVSMKANPRAKGTARTEGWTVGELAERVALPTNVLRHWESIGLLDPERDSSGYRRYGREDLVRVAVIQRNKSAGLTLDQIAVLLDGDARDRHELLEGHLRELRQRAHAIERSREMTEHALRCKAHDVTSCPRFSAFVADLVDGASGSAGDWP